MAQLRLRLQCPYCFIRFDRLGVEVDLEKGAEIRQECPDCGGWFRFRVKPRERLEEPPRDLDGVDQLKNILGIFDGFNK